MSTCMVRDGAILPLVANEESLKELPKTIAM